MLCSFAHTFFHNGKFLLVISNKILEILQIYIWEYKLFLFCSRDMLFLKTFHIFVALYFSMSYLIDDIL